MSVNFYSCCRVCTKSSDHKINTFSKEGKRKNLAAKLLECLSLNVQENDQLPKVVCEQCVQQVEIMFAFRDKCRKSQSQLTNLLYNATYETNNVKIENAPDNSVLANISNVNTSGSVLQCNNEIINSFMQVQQVDNLSHTTEKPIQQYTITLENKPKTFITDTSNCLQTTTTKKCNKNNALEILKSKNIKVTPIPKATDKQQPQQQQQQHQQHQQQQQQQQQEQQQQPLQTQHIFPQTQHQITIPATQLPIQNTQQSIQLPQQITSLQLQQFLQQQQWQQQQQQQQQQLQQLTPQFQTQQITITAPASQNILPTTSHAATNATISDALSPNRNKKTKINFVLTPPMGTVAQSTNATATGALPQFATTTGTSSIVPQSQIQWQFQSTPNAINTVNTLQSQPQQQQPQQQQQQHSQTNTTSLQTNLTPMLQQNVGISAPVSTSTMISPNKCFLPITIKDENSDQQIVAHIDAKNFLLSPYQLQMKVQPQIATADGQPIVQLTPTSIQVSQDYFANQILQALFNSTNNIQQQQQQPQLIQPQQQTPQLQTQTQTQTQHIIQQPPQHIVPTNNLQITSQQILQPANNSNNNGNFNNNNVIKNDSITVMANDQQQNDDIKLRNPTISQQNIKFTQLSANTNYEPQIKRIKTQQVQQTQHQQQQTQHQQQQTQNQQQHQQQQQQTPPPPQQQTISSTQYGAITVQRIVTGKSTATAKATMQQQSTGTTATTLAKAMTIIPKQSILNKNVTISRVTPQRQVKLSENLTKPTIQSQIQKQPQQQQQQVATKISVQQATQQKNPIQKQQIKKRQTDQLVTHVETLAGSKKIRQFATKIETTPTKQEQHETTTTTVYDTNKVTKLRVATKDANMKIKTAPPLPTSSAVKTSTATMTTMTANTNTNSAIIGVKKENKNLSNKTTEATSSVDSIAESTNTTQSSGFTCNECQKHFKKKEHLTQHSKLHTDDKPFICNVPNCGKAFKRREHLQRHDVSHSGKKMFLCDVCEKKFSRKDNLNKHKKIHASNQNSSNYSCDICSKSFTVKAYYEEHMQLHVKQEVKTEIQQKKKPTNNKNNQQSTTTAVQTQPTTQQIQIVQQQHPQQTIHVPFSTVLATPEGKTIAVTQSSNPNSWEIVQLGQTQFIDAFGSPIKITNK